MGVNLTPIVVRHETTLDALRGRTVAIDGNLELYQFLSIMRMHDGRPLMDGQGRVTSHLNGLLFRTTRLLVDYQIRPIFVFDGPPPELKRAEVERRREARQKAQRDYEVAAAAGDLGTAWSKAVAATRLTREMVADAKTLLSYLGLPWIQAPSEGEAQAAFLAHRGDAWAAGSKDYDALLFGAPRLVRFLAVQSTEFLPSRGRSRRVSPETIELSQNLGTLGLRREQLIDIAILVGTDFNEGLPGFGPKTALRRVREWGSLDRCPAELRSKLPENLEAIREFFMDPPVSTDAPAPIRPPNPASTLRFLCEERDFSPSRVQAVLERLDEASRPVRRLDDYA